MDSYEASRSLANDLLSTADSELFRTQADRSDEEHDASALLNEPGLWSESDSNDGDSDTPYVEPSLEDGLAILRTDYRDAVRFKRPAKKKGKRKPRRSALEAEPSFEIQGMLGQANQCFAVQKLDEAQTILREIIRIDPNVFAAWRTLGEVHKDRALMEITGSPEEKQSMEKCLTAFMTAAHLRPRDGPIWEDCANISKHLELIDQADYCYNKLCATKSDDVDLLWDRAKFNEAHDRNHKAIECYKHILKLLPYEMSTTRQLAHLYKAEGRIDEALKLYEETSQHYMKGRARDVFNWSELNIMAELNTEAAETEGRQELWRNVITSIKDVARWQYNRQYEGWWNDRADDAEWDADEDRRKLDPRYVKSRDPKAYDLPVDLKVKLGRARLQLNNKIEAMRHFVALESHPIEDVSDLYLEVGHALLKAKCWSEAIEVYYKITEVESTNSPEVWKAMAIAFKETEVYDQAEECLEAALADDPKNADIMVSLAEVYELQDKRQEALEMINAVIEIRRPTDEGDGRTETDDYFTVVGEDEPGFFVDRETALRNINTGSKKKRSRTTKKAGTSRKIEDLIEHERRKTEETLTRFKSLELSRDAMLVGEVDATNQYMAISSDLIDEFRGIRHFYPSEKRTTFEGVIRGRRREADVPLTVRLAGMANRLKESIVGDHTVTNSTSSLDEFRGIAFGKWFELFLQYALLLVLSGDHLEGYAVLESAATANVFYQHHERHYSLHVFMATLTIRARDVDQSQNATRWLLLNCLFRDDALRLLATGIASGRAALAKQRDTSLQKFMLRLVKTMDHITSRTDTKLRSDIDIKTIDTNPEHFRPVHSHPLVLIAYGHLLQTGTSYNAALRKYGTHVYANFRLLHTCLRPITKRAHVDILHGSCVFASFDATTVRQPTPSDHSGLRLALRILRSAYVHRSARSQARGGV